MDVAISLHKLLIGGAAYWRISPQTSYAACMGLWPSSLCMQGLFQNTRYLKTFQAMSAMDNISELECFDLTINVQTFECTHFVMFNKLVQRIVNHLIGVEKSITTVAGIDVVVLAAFIRSIRQSVTPNTVTDPYQECTLGTFGKTFFRIFPRYQT